MPAKAEIFVSEFFGSVFHEVVSVKVAANVNLCG
jgi:hypothetical protein